MSWQDSAAEIRQALKDAIPEKWTLKESPTQGLKDVTGVPATCGLLSQANLNITEQTASDLAPSLASGELSAVSVTDAFCGRAAVAHQLVNCLTAFFPEDAIRQARELYEHLKRTGTPVGPLHGIPIALKDTYDLPGYATTWGYAARASHRANRESATVKSLREEGAVFYAKTTMPQGGMMLETVSNLYGRTLNPLNTDFGAGGSSGGDGTLVALKGCSMTPLTDIGGSIRAPAAFNGLYGIRPSADRVPKRGMMSVKPVLLSSPKRCYDPSCIPMPWVDQDAPTGKLAFGLREFDRVVMPHPPILRAMRETAAKLERAGHEAIKFQMPLDCWEASQVYYEIYYQCGNEGCNFLLEQAGESPWPPMQKIYGIYKIKKGPLDARQLLKLIQTQSQYRNALSDAWGATAGQTTTGRPIDGILCPVSSLAGYAHDFLPWWGYTSLFNLVDYPSTVLPVKDLRINDKDDPKNSSYMPQSNPFDASNHEIYGPKLWSNQPVAIQLVARPFDDERLIAVTEAVDKVVNDS